MHRRHGRVVAGYHSRPVKTAELDFDLPDRLIATAAAEPRDSARLMLYRRDTGRVEHLHIRDLPTLGLFGDGDLMLVNHTRVLPAYLRGTRAATGGHVTGLYLSPAPTDTNANASAGIEPDPNTWQVMLESGGKLQPGERITLDDRASLTLTSREGGGRWLAELEADAPTLAVLQRVGATPLPPYIRKQRKQLGQDEVTDADVERYNTVFAIGQDRAHSVAAPTAGLHFTPALLAQLEAQGVARSAVELHVGAGTFAPVRVDDLDQHAMHAEHLSIPAETVRSIRDTRAHGKRILAVGTTTVRAIESLPTDLDDAAEGYATDTRLFIHPDAGFTFRYTDALLTNFHLPRSTLLAMVATLPGVGIARLQDLYQQAIARGYRFYSYGDAMLIV